MAARVKKGDRVVVLAGRDKGKQGEVLRVNPTDERVVVQGVALIKRHQKASMQNQGGIMTREAAIHASNVAHVDPKDGKPTRIGFRTLDDGRKVRFAKRSGEIIDR
ncbi:MAG: 50S ribosomal protein L24 [Geminicoccaceae bacterium]|nr:50S ribosomal protein L24 [Geminicoccaceae bacterium]